MQREPVELDDHTLVREQDVDLVAVDPDVQSRSWKAVAPREREKRVLEPRPRGSDRLFDEGPEALGARVPPGPLEQLPAGDVAVLTAHERCDGLVNRPGQRERDQLLAGMATFRSRSQCDPGRRRRHETLQLRDKPREVVQRRRVR